MMKIHCQLTIPTWIIGWMRQVSLLCNRGTPIGLTKRLQTHFIPTRTKLPYFWGIGIGITDTRSLRQVLRHFLILLDTQNITPKMCEPQTGQRSIRNSARVTFEITKLRKIASGWMSMVDGRRLLFRYALPFIVVLGTLAQRIILSRTFTIVPWSISFVRIYWTLLITASSIMNHMSCAGTHPTGTRMRGFMGSSIPLRAS